MLIPLKTFTGGFPSKSNLLDWVDPGHCEKNVEKDEGRGNA